MLRTSLSMVTLLIARKAKSKGFSHEPDVAYGEGANLRYEWISVVMPLLREDSSVQHAAASASDRGDSYRASVTHHDSLSVPLRHLGHWRLARAWLHRQGPDGILSAASCLEVGVPELH